MKKYSLLNFISLFIILLFSVNVYGQQTVIKAGTGFTTVRDAGNAGEYADVDVKRAINESLVAGSNMFVAGKIIAPFGGQFRTKADKKFLMNDEYYFADTQDELKKPFGKIFIMELM